MRPVSHKLFASTHLNWNLPWVEIRIIRVVPISRKIDDNATLPVLSWMIMKYVVCGWDGIGSPETALPVISDTFLVAIGAPINICTLHSSAYELLHSARLRRTCRGTDRRTDTLPDKKRKVLFGLSAERLDNSFDIFITHVWRGA